MGNDVTKKLEKLNLLDRFLFDSTMESRECPELTLDDGALRVFINTAGTNKEDFSEEFLALMKYLSSTTDEVAEASGSEKITQIHNRVRQIKLSEKMGGKYMLRWEELEYARMDGVEEGMEKGREEGREEGRSSGLLEGRLLGEEETLIKMICHQNSWHLLEIDCLHVVRLLKKRKEVHFV